MTTRRQARSDILAGFALTGHFLERDVLAPHGLAMPQAQRAPDRLSRAPRQDPGLESLKGASRSAQKETGRSHRIGPPHFFKRWMVLPPPPTRPPRHRGDDGDDDDDVRLLRSCWSPR